MGVPFEAAVKVSITDKCSDKEWGVIFEKYPWPFQTYLTLEEAKAAGIKIKEEYGDKVNISVLTFVKKPNL
jgi:hypothetical protein